MRTLIERLGFTLFWILLTACQPAPTELPTALPTSTPTISLPTLTPIPPTATLFTPTPIPTANFVIADILGMWTRSDFDRGTLFLIFNEDGSYVASHGTPEGIVHSGEFTLDGRVFTFVNGWNCSPLGETEGQYILRLTGGGKFLLFEPLNDECPDRPNAFKGLRWDRVVVTPNP